MAGTLVRWEIPSVKDRAQTPVNKQGVSHLLVIFPAEPPLNACGVDRGLLAAWHLDANSVTSHMGSSALARQPSTGAASFSRPLHQCLRGKDGASMAGKAMGIFARDDTHS